MRALTVLPATLAVLLAACYPRPLPPAPAPTPLRPPPAPCTHPTEFIVVQLNDVYKISPFDAGRTGGMARVATVVKQLRARNPNTIAILSGDFVSPSLISSLSQINSNNETVPVAGEQMVAAMNAVGIDYVTFGNHEFDIPLASLQSRLAELNATVVSSNVRRRIDSLTTQPFVQIAAGTRRPVPEHAVHAFRGVCDDVRLGLIGLTLPFNDQAYVTYEDIDLAARRAYDAARAESDLVFAITHLTIREDSALARWLPKIPLIMGGHEHEKILTQVGPTRISKADANAKTVYIHWVTWYPETRETEIWSQLMPITDDIAEDAGVASIVRLWEERADALILGMRYEPNEVVARFDTAYDGREASVRNKPTNLGQTIACAMLAADTATASPATLALLNSGSIRLDDQLTGEITQREVLRTMPFGGPIVRGRIKGRDLGRILTIGHDENMGEGGYLQTTPNVRRTGNAWVIDGRPLVDDRDYEVVLSGFLSEGREANLEFMKELAYDSVPGLTVEANDLRRILIAYLPSKPADWEMCGSGLQGDP